MSGNQDKQDEDDNELLITKNEGINDEGDGDDDTIDHEEIDEHDDEDYESVEYVDNNEPEESDKNEGNSYNNEEDIDIDNNNIYYGQDFDNDDISCEEISQDDCRLQKAIRDQKSGNRILKLIELYPMDVQHKNYVGDYPLHTALAYGNNKIAMKLIEVFPEAAYHKSSSGQYPLHLALENCSRKLGDDVVMKLIEIFPTAVIESTTYGTTLHFACIYLRSEKIIRKLIEINPQAIQEQNEKGKYPIQCLIQRRASIEFFKLFLDGDPMVMQRIVKSSFGDDATLFHIACEKGGADFVSSLMQRADLQINVRDGKGMTPLHYTCHRRCHTIVDMLLNHPDIDVNATDNMNDTTLHKTIKLCSGLPEKRVDMVRMLLDHPCIFIHQKNNDDKSPLDLIKDDLNNVQIGCRHMFFPKELELQCIKEIINLLQDFTIKRRWQALCYHLNEINDL